MIAGLVTLDEMRAKQQDVVKAREKQIVINKGESRLYSEADGALSEKHKKKKAKQVRCAGFVFLTLESTKPNR